MKINEVIQEGILDNLKTAGKKITQGAGTVARGLGQVAAMAPGALAKGAIKAIAPQTMQTYQQQKNALRTPQTAGDPAMANVASTTSNVATTTSQAVTPAPVVDINKIQAAPKPGLPTSAERAKLDQAIQAQLKGQR